jgi:hypothetical protein
MVLESPRCTVDILSQILYDKTVDVGKICEVLKVKKISCIVNWLGQSFNYKQWQGCFSNEA